MMGHMRVLKMRVVSHWLNLVISLHDDWWVKDYWRIHHTNAVRLQVQTAPVMYDH